MPKQRNDGLLYLQQYPRLKKWINQCAVCQRLGRKAEMPDEIEPGVAARNLRRYFTEMSLDAIGRCEQCRTQ
jgi:hypothetical protein